MKRESLFVHFDHKNNSVKLTHDLPVRFKKLRPDAKIPEYAKPGDAGLDLTAVSMERDGDVITYKLGLAMAVPAGYVGLIFPRSSIYKYDLEMTNSVGVIDAGYRGELVAKFRLTKHTKDDLNIYKPGERVCQLMIVPFPAINIEEVEELEQTERGAGGHGSTGI